MDVGLSAMVAGHVTDSGGATGGMVGSAAVPTVRLALGLGRGLAVVRSLPCAALGTRGRPRLRRDRLRSRRIRSHCLERQGRAHQPGKRPVVQCPVVRSERVVSSAQCGPFPSAAPPTWPLPCGPACAAPAPARPLRQCRARKRRCKDRWQATIGAGHAAAPPAAPSRNTRPAPSRHNPPSPPRVASPSAASALLHSP